MAKYLEAGKDMKKWQYSPIAGWEIHHTAM
jgi:hypothetical protein